MTQVHSSTFTGSRAEYLYLPLVGCRLFVREVSVTFRPLFDELDQALQNIYFLDPWKLMTPTIY